jgi:Ca2+-binding RTX toxin-like protein
MQVLRGRLLGAALIAPTVLALAVASPSRADDTDDTAGPQANPTVAPVPNAAGWHRDDATVMWNWTDDGAGIDPAHCPDQTTSTGEGEIMVTATCADLAGNETTATHTVNVDSTAPTVTLTSPGTVGYRQGAAVSADYRCADGTSGVDACTGTFANGAPIDTSIRGQHPFVVTAVDRAGNQFIATVTYSVVAVPTCHGAPATIVGTAGNDVVTGTPGPDVIVTGGGRDWVRARGGDDVVCAGAARDVVSAGPGDDSVHAGAARDSVFGGDGDDTVTGGLKADIVTGGNGNDTVTGSAGNDTIFGHDGDDQLVGSTGSDTCRGGSGRDRATACELTVGIP